MIKYNDVNKSCLLQNIITGVDYIHIPIGNNSPDWAIAFNEGSVKHIYFVAETKGSLDSMELRGVEGAKIECAKKLFNKMSSSNVRYEYVTNYSDLLDKMNGLA